MCGGSCNNCNGIAQTLAIIVRAQDTAERIDENLYTCDKPFLGPCPVKNVCNTRPIMIFTCNNEPLTIPINEHCSSSVFRVMSLDAENCTASCMVLKKKHHKDMDENWHDDCNEYEKTDSFFVVNLCCVCCIKCLPDTFVDCI
jgi:hypothetical protein